MESLGKAFVYAGLALAAAATHANEVNQGRSEESERGLTSGSRDVPVNVLPDLEGNTRHLAEVSERLNPIQSDSQALDLPAITPTSQPLGRNTALRSLTTRVANLPRKTEPGEGWSADKVRTETLPEPGTLLLMLLGLLGLGLARRRTAHKG